MVQKFRKTFDLIDIFPLSIYTMIKMLTNVILIIIQTLHMPYQLSLDTAQDIHSVHQFKPLRL